MIILTIKIQKIIAFYLFNFIERIDLYLNCVYFIYIICFQRNNAYSMNYNASLRYYHTNHKSKIRYQYCVSINNFDEWSWLIIIYISFFRLYA